MASNEHKLTLTNIPLEVRHHIFEYVATRNLQPKRLLRYWFEKKELKEKMVELAAQNLKVSALQVMYEGGQFEHEEDEEHDSDNNEEEGVSGEDGEQDGEENANEDEQEASENESESGEDAEMEDTDSTADPLTPMITDPGNTLEPTTSAVPVSQPSTQGQQDPSTAAQETASAATDQSLTDAEHDLSAATSVANTPAHVSTAAVPASTLAPAQMHDQYGTEDEGADADMDEDGDDQNGAQDGTEEEGDAEMGEDNENDDENGDIDVDSDEGMAEEDSDTGTETGVAQLSPPTLVLTAHTKWRHIPQVRVKEVYIELIYDATTLSRLVGLGGECARSDGEYSTDKVRHTQFMRITHCPPPVELLLASKQLNAEAKSWFYDVAMLCIDATGSFAHTSFFEEAFSQITKATFSPIVDIRKVEVTFVWDTTWIRSEQADCAAAIFPALLRQRALFVTNILALAPSLSEVTIHWHDSAQDIEAIDLMNDVLMGFLGLDADVKVEPHFIAADAMPYRTSIAGKQRVEFQRIVDNGLDSLF